MIGAIQVKKLRQITGLSQTDFGEKIGVPQDRVSLYENGKTRVLLDSFLEWCDVFGVDFEIKEKYEK